METIPYLQYTDGLLLYRYAKNPLSYFDPLGLSSASGCDRDECYDKCTKTQANAILKCGPKCSPKEAAIAGCLMMANYDMDAGHIEKRTQTYTVKGTAAFTMPIKDANPTITIDQKTTVELIRE